MLPNSHVQLNYLVARGARKQMGTHSNRASLWINNIPSPRVFSGIERIGDKPSKLSEVGGEKLSKLL